MLLSFCDFFCSFFDLEHSSPTIAAAAPVPHFSLMCFSPTLFISTPALFLTHIQICKLRISLRCRFRLCLVCTVLLRFKSVVIILDLNAELFLFTNPVILALFLPHISTTFLVASNILCSDTNFSAPFRSFFEADTKTSGF